MNRFRAPCVALLCVSTILAPGCATTQYTPQVVARGELVLKYQGGFEMWAGGRRISRGLLYKNLHKYVRCVPAAGEEARQAARDGGAAVALSVLGGTLGGAALGGLYGIRDQDHFWAWIGGGIALAVVGTVFAGLGRKLRNSANGHAVDALNFYNDSVGSLGATCDDLRYPAPAGPMEELPPPPTAPEPPQEQGP